MENFDKISFDPSALIRKELFNHLREKILTGEAPPGTRRKADFEAIEATVRYHMDSTKKDMISTIGQEI